MQTTNAFGNKIPEIKEIMGDRVVRDYIKDTLIGVLELLETEDPNSLVDKVLFDAAECDTITDYERKVRKLLEQNRVISKISEKLTKRANIIYDQIKRYVNGNVLDLGCWDGRIGEKIAQEQRLEVILADISKHDNIDSIGLDFVELTQGENIPLGDNQYDTTLLLTVLHHVDDPEKVLKEARRVTKRHGNIILIESVQGIDDDTNFGRLTSEQQRLANIFFDHFYNRIVHYSDDLSKKVNVPYNHNTPQAWNNIFKQHGLRAITSQYLGIDQPIVPEPHMLYVVEVQ